jgi:hypothetical protein
MRDVSRPASARPAPHPPDQPYRPLSHSYKAARSWDNIHTSTLNKARAADREFGDLRMLSARPPEPGDEKPVGSISVRKQLATPLELEIRVLADEFLDDLVALGPRDRAD